MTAIGSGALLQAVSLVIFARSLGPSEYAVIVLASAISMVAAAFADLGCGDLLIREVSRDPRAYRAAFGRALWLSGLAIVPASLAGTLLGLLAFDTAASAIVLLTLITSEVVASRGAAIADQIAIAHHATHVSTLIRLLATFTRFAAVCIAVFAAGVSTASEWAIFAAGSSAVVAIGCLMIAIVRFGAPDARHGPGPLTKTGMLFALMQIIRAMQFALDKFAVASVATPATLGAFGVASRASQLAVMPASAITRITYPVFFREGAQGLDAALAYAARIAPAVLGVGLLSSAGLIVIAFMLPFLLGPEFALSRTFLILLALLPFASTIQNLTGDVLSGSDRQAHRIAAAVAGVALTAAMAFAGAHSAGVIGAIIGYISGHVLFGVITGLTVLYLRQRTAG